MKNGPVSATKNAPTFPPNSIGSQQLGVAPKLTGPPSLNVSRSSSGASSPSLPIRYPSRPMSTGQFNPVMTPPWTSQSLPSSNRASPNLPKRGDGNSNSPVPPSFPMPSVGGKPIELPPNLPVRPSQPVFPPKTNPSNIPLMQPTQGPINGPPNFKPMPRPPGPPQPSPPMQPVSNTRLPTTNLFPNNYQPTTNCPSNTNFPPTNTFPPTNNAPPTNTFTPTSNFPPTNNFPPLNNYPPTSGYLPNNNMPPPGVVIPYPNQHITPPVNEPPAPPSNVENLPSRLGAAGLKAKRPTPSYNFNTPVPPNSNQRPVPMQPVPPQSLPNTNIYPPNNSDDHSMNQGQPPLTQQPNDFMSDRMRKMSLSEMSCINLMEHRCIYPPKETLSCVPPLPPDLLTKNKYPENFACTTNVVPASSNLLSKLKIPFGLVIQPFKNLGDEIPIVSPPIPRCKVCRTYVNPYAQLNDGGRRWKCNICSRLNDMPADYFYGEDGRRIPFDVSSRPELNSALIEYLAPSEYTTRPPQAAMYLYLIDVSYNAVQSGMVKMTCKILEEELDKIRGDKRASLGIICFDSKLYYFNLHKNSGQPQMLVVSDLGEPFTPTLDELVVNINESKEKIKGLLSIIPSIFHENQCPEAAGGPALNAAKDLMFRTGGRITLMLSREPSIGIGVNKKRNSTPKTESLVLAPMDDFYKSFALEATQKQVSVDLFLFPNEDMDLPTVSSSAQFSSGSVYYYPQYHHDKNPLMAERFLNEFRHYVTRPIAFEAVLRIRCTSGINIHSFFGNCFVRAHDLIALANVSPDVAFGVQTNIDDNLHENKLAIFQSALLYTSSHGDRRIRVHTLGLPISNDPQTIYNNLNIDTSIALLAKMAVEKTNTSSLGDAREALQYAVIDPLTRYRTEYCPSTKGTGQLIVPKTQRLLPLYISSLLKTKALRLQFVPDDERFYSMLQLKTLPVDEVLLQIYPRLYSIHNLHETWTDKGSLPPRLPLTAEKLTRQGAFLLQTHEIIIIWVGRHVSELWINSMFNKSTYQEINEYQVGLEHYDNTVSDSVHDLISLLRKIRELTMSVVVVREDTRYGHIFLKYLMEDKADGMISYYEFLQKIQQQVG